MTNQSSKILVKFLFPPEILSNEIKIKHNKLRN